MDIIRQKTPHKSVNQNFSQDDERKKKGKGSLKKAEATVLKNIDVAAILRK
jgi:stalled ribosome alternative rescue factor ArfA